VLAGGSAAVVQWFEGSGLRPYLVPLPVMRDGSVLLPFPRIFLVAVAP
jgi:trans-aconitate 2-methyltransferase